MDFSKLTKVGNANPAGQKFDLKLSKAKEEFRFSDKLFAQMQLEYNSLAQFDNTEGKVIIAVCPGNSGVFYKKSTGKVKGKRFKNSRLAQACEVAGLPVDLSANHLGSFEDKEMYEIVSRIPAGVEDNPLLTKEEKSAISEDAHDEMIEIGDEKVNDVEPVNDQF